MTKIKDIYAGKPDAKDEIEINGAEAFLANYIVPENFNVDELISGDGYFITGYKGTGKTAVLYYLDSLLKAQDIQTATSFIFFKGDYSDSKKEEMEKLARRVTSTISIGSDVALSGTDFEYIWRWLFYLKIVSDNNDFNGGLFKKDDNWRLFENKISQIKQNRKRGLAIPPKLSFSIPIVDSQNGMQVSPNMELDFKNAKMQELDTYKAFTGIIDEADELLKNVERTDIPYFIFVDELEAYFGEDKVFKRDLRLIRDLIFTTKKINLILNKKSNAKTKIICSVRSEIINSIYSYK